MRHLLDKKEMEWKQITPEKFVPTGKNPDYGGAK